MFIPRLSGNQCRELIKQLCAWQKCVAERWASKGAHSIYINCSHRRRVHMSVLFIVVKVRLNTRSSLCTLQIGKQNESSIIWQSVKFDSLLNWFRKKSHHGVTDGKFILLEFVREPVETIHLPCITYWHFVFIFTKDRSFEICDNTMT